MAVAGSPIPKIREVTAVRRRQKNNEPPEREIMKLVTFPPRPVTLITPRMIPAQAQAAATATAFSPPCRKDLPRVRQFNTFLLPIKTVSKRSMIDQKPARMADQPIPIQTTRPTNGTKAYQPLIRLPKKEGIFSRARPCHPLLAAATSTMKSKQA